MPQTPRNSWPFPAEGQDPFWDDFQAFADACDASVFAVKETSNLVLMGGGTITFSAGLGTISWSADIIVQAATTGFTSAIPGLGTGGSIALADLQFLYVQLTRAPQSAQALVPKVGSKLDPGDDYFVLAFRSSNKIYWRNGVVQSDGQELTDFASGGDLAGDVTGAARHNTVARVRGAKVQTQGVQLQLGKVLEVVAGSDPVIAKFVPPAFYIVRPGCDDLLVGEPASFQQAVLPNGTQPTTADVGGGSLWVGSATLPVLYRVDSTTKIVLATFNLPAPFTGVDKVLYDGSDVWICQGSVGSFARLNLAALALTVYLTGHATGYYDLFLDGAGILLFGAGDGFVAKIVKSSGVVSAEALAPHVGHLVFEPMLTLGKLAVLDRTNARLYRYDLGTSAFDAIDFDLIGASPVGLAFDSSSLLVAFAGGTVRQVTSATTTPALGFGQSLATGAVPTSVVWDAVNAVFWVAEGGLDEVEGVPQAGGIVTQVFSVAGLLDYAVGGGGGTLTNLSSVLIVDVGTPVAGPDQSGNTETPFSTLTQAAVALETMVATNGFAIGVTTGDYSAEPPVVIASGVGTRVTFSPHPVGSDEFAQSWVTSGISYANG